MGAFRSLISASYRNAWICSGVICEKFGVRPTGVDISAMPGVPKGVAPGVKEAMPPPKGVAPGVMLGSMLNGVALGVASVGVASTLGVASALGSLGVSSQRARFFFFSPAPAPGVGVSPHWPGVGVSMPSAPPPGVSSHWPFLLSSSIVTGVSMPPPPTGVAHLSPSFSSALAFSPSLPVFESQRRFFFSAALSSALPSALATASSSFCFWIFRSTSCFSLSSAWPTMTSL
mmetsp:Transcript_17170/g.36415  ORF Transcript_17170/g.36415 Transcript_17170/m.36415 type:complete len:231 (+) Transcript_17170:2769-3461(+)